MSQTIARLFVVCILAAAIGFAAEAAAPDARSKPAIDRLKAENPGARVSISPATGAARFMRLAPASMLRLAPVAPQGREVAFGASAAAFLDRHGAAFGLRGGSAELALQRTRTDQLGQTHLTYAQRYAGLPVFGAQLKLHFDASGRMTIVNGLVIPDISVSARPSRSRSDAESAAVAFVKRNGVSVRNSRLLIYREGLAKGVPGKNHLAYEVEVGNGRNVREFVYVDAHSGKPIDKITGTPDANRRAYDAHNLTAPGPDYPASPFWIEGQAFPTGNVEADNMIQTSGETYNLFFNAFQRDSFDDAGATMDSIFNRGNACPNASWNGIFISFCPGLTTDDVTGHEWGHAYTEYTDGLIYAWQSGALNEAASDIFGETVDLINGRDNVGTNGPRTDGSCTVHTALPPVLTINSPLAIAGVKQTGGAAFGPQVFNVTANVTLANDGVGATSDGCTALAGFPAGDIALIDRGSCAFTVKAANAQAAGASGVIIGNNAAGPAPGLGGADPTIVIPVLSLSLADATAVKANFPVNATMERTTGSDGSARWLLGEDST
ncbi:MAG: PA domain-containing protein, partial [Planctomycetaceae bacterium]